MDLAGNVSGRPGGVPTNRLWPWALHLLSLIGGGPKPQEFTLPSEYNGCDYYQKIPIGSIYYVYSPGYDSGTTFPEGIACRWQAESPENAHLELDCTDFQVGRSVLGSSYCAGDRLLVTPTGDPTMTDAEVHCGEENFMVTSVRNKMTLVFLSDYEDDPMDRFLCSIKAVRDEPPPCDCGRRNEMRIVGGIETGVNEFPMMAGVVDPVIRRLFCGATIISRRYAVTAAHCFTPRDPDPMGLGLLVGDHNISTGADTTSAKLYKITQIIIHPNYENLKEGNDIALVKVGHSDADGIQFGKNVGPVCLPFRYLTESFSGERVIALGWGSTEFGGDTSDALMETFLSVVPIQSCIDAYKGKVNYRQICTFEEGSDTCQSDSGGPILWFDRATSRIQILGIVSYGVSCASDVPSVSTRVSSFLDWIVLTTNEEYCVA